MWGLGQKAAVCQPRRPQENQPCLHLALGLPAPTAIRNRCLVEATTYGAVSWWLEPPETLGQPPGAT